MWQGAEPIMLVNLNPDGKIFGQAHLVRADNRVLNAYHSEAKKVLKYLTYYNNPNANIEPQSRFVSLIHREYQPGGMPLESLNPLMTELQ